MVLALVLGPGAWSWCWVGLARYWQAMRKDRSWLAVVIVLSVLLASIALPGAAKAGVVVMVRSKSIGYWRGIPRPVLERY